MSRNSFSGYKPILYMLLIPFLYLNFKEAKAQADKPKPVFNFKGKYLVAVSDADMVAAAYLDGHLGAAAGKDALSVIALDKPVNQLKAVFVEASNSVTGPPSSVAVSPDGRYAIVIETRGQRPVGKADPLFSDLPDGKLIQVFDLLDPDHPKLVQKLNGPERPLSVTFHPQGNLVLITYRPANAAASPLAMYRFEQGKLSDLSFPAVPGCRRGDVLNGVAFHPGKNVLVLINATQSVLTFTRFLPDKRSIALTRWGEAVPVDKEPFKACFTPDGRFVIVNAMYSGVVRGSASSVAVQADTLKEGTPVHQLVSHVLTGVLPEGLAMSPGGDWIVTTNLEQSTQPFYKPEQGFYASLTLMHLNLTSGLLESKGEFAFDGILPESAVFDNTGQYLAVAIFDHYNAQQPGGSVSFWRLTSDYFNPDRVLLVKTDYSVPVTRGIHSMVISR